MITQDGIKRKSDGFVDSAPSEKGCKVLDREVTDG